MIPVMLVCGSNDVFRLLPALPPIGTNLLVVIDGKKRNFTVEKIVFQDKPSDNTMSIFVLCFEG